LSKSAENGFGAGPRAVLGDGRTPGCPNQMGILALGGLEVCDGGHWLGVMKKGSSVGIEFRGFAVRHFALRNSFTTPASYNSTGSFACQQQS
jgi:hypothetical protein